MKIRNLTFKSLPGYVRTHYTMLFWLLLIVLFGAEAFMLRGSVQQMIQANKPAAPVKQSSGVRVNFTDYQKIVSRIEKGQNYQPTSLVTRDPFVVNRDLVPVQP
jgi:hypothetical protein